MTSPLLDYANGYLLVDKQGTPEIVDGRVTFTASNTYLVQCYLKRQDSAGTSTGADYIPAINSTSNSVPGASGQVYLYRGYALRYASVSPDYDLEALNLNGINFIEFNFPIMPAWLVAGVSGLHKQGDEKLAHCAMQSSSGKFGNAGIDKIINESISGIPVVVRSGQVLN